MLKQLPNILSSIRIALILPMLVGYYAFLDYGHYIAALCFSLAALTDFLDGYLARLFLTTSRLGELLDPIADKLIVATALVLLIESYSSLLYTIPALIIILREIAVSGLRSWLLEGSSKDFPVSSLGKLKTATQLIAIILLLAFYNISEIMEWIGLVLLYAAAILSLVSMLQYAHQAFLLVQKED